MKTMEGSAVVGIDVSKASLDVSVSAGPARRFDNNRGGHRRPVAIVGGAGGV